MKRAVRVGSAVLRLGSWESREGVLAWRDGNVGLCCVLGSELGLVME